MPACYPVTVISLMNSEVLLQIEVATVELVVLTKACSVLSTSLGRHSGLP
jgi:hypothetical protein